MTERGTFGRRGVDEKDRHRVFRTEIGEPIEVVLKRPGMSPGRIALGVLGILIGINILVQSGRGDDPFSPTKPATIPAATKTAQSSPSCAATMAEYLALGIGTSLSQARSIIGCSGTEISRISYDGVDEVMVSWPGTKGLFANMNATFDNDRLIAKAQLGLE